jgi:transposase-like protein
MGGESLEAVSRDLGVTVAQLSEWRDDALASAEAGLKAQPRDQRDDEIARLKSKLGDVTMDNELLQEKIERLEARASPSRGRRSKK